METGRRDVLRYCGLLGGTAAGRAFLAGWLAGNAPAGAQEMHHHAAPQPAEPAAPRFFRPDEYRTVEILTETIIPTDDQPGAREAQVARFIDFVVYSAAEFEPGLQERWVKGLVLLDNLSREQFGRVFRELTPANREQLLAAMSLPERDASAAHPGFSFYKLVKSMTVEGFYTSRIGLIEVLEYQGLAALAEFQGCTHPEHQA